MDTRGATHACMLLLLSLSLLLLLLSCMLCVTCCIESCCRFWFCCWLTFLITHIASFQSWNFFRRVSCVFLSSFAFCHNLCLFLSIHSSTCTAPMIQNAIFGKQLFLLFMIFMFCYFNTMFQRLLPPILEVANPLA